MYDYLIDTITNFIRHGLNSTAIILSIIALFRVNGIRRIILRRLPKRFRHEDNLERIERKIDALSAHMGVEPCGTSEIAISGRQSYVKSWITSCKATLKSLYSYRLRRKKKMMNKLKSRKFLLALVSAGLIVANDGLSLGINNDTILAFAGIVITWILGESAVDAKRAGKEQTNDSTFRNPIDSAE